MKLVSVTVAFSLTPGLLKILRLVAMAEDLGGWYGLASDEVEQVQTLAQEGLIFRHLGGPLASFRATKAGKALLATLAHQEMGTTHAS